MRPLLASFALLFGAPAGARAAEAPTVAELIRQLETGGAGERVIAAERLGDRGPAAADAIPVLARAAGAALRGTKVGDAESRRANRHLYKAAIDALAGIGPKSAPALAELLPGEKDDNFGPIEGVLQSFGHDAAPAVPALAKLLADENQDFRVRVAGILEAIGPGAEPATPELIGLFRNEKNKNSNRFATGPLPPPPRVAAVRVLVRIGPKGLAAITDTVLPVLAQELKTGEHRPGGSPLEVLSVLGETGATLVPTVADLARRSEAKFDRQDAGEALLGLGATGRKEFGKLLAGPDVKVRRVLVETLKWALWHEHFPKYHHFEAPPLDIAPYGPALVKALADAEPEHRLAAAEVLCKGGEKTPPEVVDAAAALFDDPAVKKYVEARGVLIFPTPQLADFGEPGVRALVRLLDSDSLAIRKLAVGQLAYGSPRRWSAAGLPRLRKLTEHADTELAIGATYAATVLSLEPKDAAPLVGKRFVGSTDAEVRESAANHLGWLGSLGVPYHEALIPLLDDKDDKVVQAAAEAIDSHAPKGSAAARALADRKLVRDETLKFVVKPKARPEPAPSGVPELIRALSADDDDRRVTAALDLGDRGAAAKEAVPALKPLVADPDPALRFAAAYALARIGNDLPALRRLLTAEFERAARGRPATPVAAVAFERLPPDFPEIIPFAARWLERERGGTVLTNGLRKYGPKAKDAVPALRVVLRGPAVMGHVYLDGEFKSACEALGAIGPDARAALPELRQRLDTGSVEVALAARDAIRKIEGGK